MLPLFLERGDECWVWKLHAFEAKPWNGRGGEEDAIHFEGMEGQTRAR